MNTQPRRVAESLWWPVYSLETLTVTGLLREGVLRPDDICDQPPHESMLMLALLAEDEDAMHGADDFGAHEAYPTMSALLLAAGANPTTVHQRTNESALSFCESMVDGRMRHERAARLIRSYAGLDLR